eukprot:Pompholyxophrys_punicea_v1_NODE_8_length_8388_cov_12.748020.p8 type:complete len:110 gc:universal NODE_8_length_8388_cov_12.748020:2517-2846(+)
MITSVKDSYLKEQCVELPDIITSIKNGALGDFKKVSKINSYYNQGKKQHRIVIDLKDSKNVVRSINLLAVIDNGKPFINKRSFEFIVQQYTDDTTFVDSLQQYCDEDSV